MIDREGRSPWFHFGIGCTVLLVLGLLVAGTALFVGLRTAHSVRVQMNDAERRESRSLELLGAERLPPGYHAALNLSVPLVMELVILSDHPPHQRDSPGPEGESVFGYVELRGGPREVDAVLEQGIGDILAGQGIELDLVERLDRGTLKIGRQEVSYELSRGRYTTGAMPGWTPGRIALFSIACPAGSRSRSAVWLTPEPEVVAFPDESPTYDQQIVRLLEPLDLCAG